MTKAEELKEAVNELEVQITSHIASFLVENGACEIDINVDNRKIEVARGVSVAMHPKVTVTIKI